MGSRGCRRARGCRATGEGAGSQGWAGAVRWGWSRWDRTEDCFDRTDAIHRRAEPPQGEVRVTPIFFLPIILFSSRV